MGFTIEDLRWTSQKKMQRIVQQSCNSSVTFKDMTGYELAATILVILLAVLFIIYARTKRNVTDEQSVESDFQKSPGLKSDPSRANPDLISQAAKAIFKGHKILNNILAIIIVGVILADAFYDPLTRIVVLSTIGVMLLIVLIWFVWQKSK